MLLILASGIVTDRIGGANAILYGNGIVTVGSILVAAATHVRNYRFMVGGRVIAAFGDIATQVAQYKIFSSWFPPNNGFASTLAFELAIGKIGGFVGKSTANIIAKVELPVSSSADNVKLLLESRRLLLGLLDRCIYEHFYQLYYHHILLFHKSCQQTIYWHYGSINWREIV